MSKVFTKNQEVVLRSGARFILRDTHSSDLGTLLEVAGSDDYMMSSIRSPRVIVDAGANIGAFAIIAARMYPDAIVHAVEPEESNFKQLLLNIEKNGVQNIKPLQAAISSQYGETELYLSNHPAAHTLRPIHGAVVRKVKTIPLSHFGHIDALKMDIEGGEYMALEKEIPDCGYLAIEVHADPRKKELLRRLSAKYNVQRNNRDVFIFA